MKRAILMVFLLVSTMAFSQMTNNEIMSIILKSKELNKENGITNPNLVYPGQLLTFLFEDGTVQYVHVQPGDNQWTIVREISQWAKLHGQVQPWPKADTAKAKVIDFVHPDPFEFKWWETNWILAVPIGLVLLLIMVYLLNRSYNSRNQDPVYAGTPQVSGGVSDANAYSRMNEIAGNNFPASRLEIKNIRRGWLSGLAKVHYASGKPKKINLKGVPAYAGEIRVNGIDQTIYFLQGCGNDARQGNYMFGSGLVFTPNVVVNQDGSESPLPVEPVITETAVEDQPAAPVVNSGSETHQQRMKVLSMIETEVAKGEVHEVTFDMNPDNFGVHLKYKWSGAKTSKGLPEDQK